MARRDEKQQLKSSASQEPPAGEQAASGVESLPDEIAAQLKPDQIVLQPFYHDLRNEIVDPKRVRVESAYFWEKWVPRLGPVLSILIMKLRQHCYYNKQTKERRDWCFPTQETLAREVGVSIDTIQRALDPRKNPLVSLFVTRQYRSRYDPVRGCTVRTSSLYQVAMDDPLIPEDEARLLEMAADRLQAAQTSSPPLSQTEEQQAHKEPARRKKARIKPQDAALQPEEPVKPQNAALSNENAVKPQIAALHDDSVKPQSASLHATANCGKEEIPQETQNITTTTTTARANSNTDAASEQDTGPAQVIALFAAANQRSVSVLERESLERLVSQYGLEQVLAAIREAVEAGSAFVAPRRIERICERWKTAPDRPAVPVQPAPRNMHTRKRDTGYIPNTGPQAVLPGFEDVTNAPEPTETDLGDDAQGDEDAPVITPGSEKRARQIWRIVLDEMQHEVPAAQISAWLQPVHTLGLDAQGNLVVRCRNSYSRQWVEQHYVEKLRQILIRNGVASGISIV